LHRRHEFLPFLWFGDLLRALVASSFAQLDQDSQ
jgi:hypothetical protein